MNKLKNKMQRKIFKTKGTIWKIHEIQKIQEAHKLVN
jgi:hypothetical protein